MSRKYILDASTVEMKLQRMAFEIIESNLGEDSILLIGVRDNGSVIARHMKTLLEKESNLKISLIHLTIDKIHPSGVALSEDPGFDDKVIILVDDVANSGKTMLYALKPFLEHYPKKIQTLALVERTHKAFPIHLDYTGLSVATTLHEHIYVEVQNDQVTGAYME